MEIGKRGEKPLPTKRAVFLGRKGMRLRTCIQAARHRSADKKLLGFKTPARSIVSLPKGRASRIHGPKDKFRARETLKMATEKKTSTASTENDATSGMGNILARNERTANSRHETLVFGANNNDSQGSLARAHSSAEWLCRNRPLPCISRECGHLGRPQQARSPRSHAGVNGYVLFDVCSVNIAFMGCFSSLWKLAIVGSIVGTLKAEPEWTATP